MAESDLLRFLGGAGWTGCLMGKCGEGWVWTLGEVEVEVEVEWVGLEWVGEGLKIWLGLG